MTYPHPMDDHTGFADPNEQWETCDECGGEGSVEIHRPQHDDPNYCEVRKCQTCNGTGWVSS